MSWFHIVGLLLICGNLIFLFSIRHSFTFSRIDPSAAGPFGDARDERLLRHLLDRQHARRRLVMALAAVLLLVGMLLLYHVAPTSPALPALPVPPSPSPPPQAWPGEAYLPASVWLSAGLLTMLFLGGVLLLIVGPTTLTRATGALTVVASIAGHAYLIKEVKIDSLFKIDGKIEKLGLELQWNRKVIQQLSEFGPTLLGTVTDFDSGSAEIKKSMGGEIAQLCQQWPHNSDGKSRGVLLVIGSTDRVPLTVPSRRQYESNVGLARARAEQVAASMVACGIAESQIVKLVSGPAHTPAGGAARIPAGYAGDRKVIVWALRSLPTVPLATDAAQ